MMLAKDKFRRTEMYSIQRVLTSASLEQSPQQYDWSHVVIAILIAAGVFFTFFIVQRLNRWLNRSLDKHGPDKDPLVGQAGSSLGRLPRE
jgi:hypothetical protein